MTSTEPIQLISPVDEVREAVRVRYAEAALAAGSSAAAAEAAERSEALRSCCGPDGSIAFGSPLYDAADRDALPDAAVLASLGCGNPTAVAELREGETVLDLGSGGGIDVLLSARRVGATGRAIGVDMTDEMLELARRNAADAGATNVEFRKGTIEDLPLDAGSVDVVISNCVINLSADKAAVLSEIARVLREGIEPTHGVASGLHGAIIRASKPADWTGVDRERLAAAVPSPSATRDLAFSGDLCDCDCEALGCC